MGICSFIQAKTTLELLLPPRSCTPPWLRSSPSPPGRTISVFSQPKARMKIVFVDVLHRNQEARMKVVFVAVQLLSTCSSTMAVRRLTISHLSPTEEQKYLAFSPSPLPPRARTDSTPPRTTSPSSPLPSRTGSRAESRLGQVQAESHQGFGGEEGDHEANLVYLLLVLLSFGIAIHRNHYLYHLVIIIIIIFIIKPIIFLFIINSTIIVINIINIIIIIIIIIIKSLTLLSALSMQ